MGSVLGNGARCTGKLSSGAVLDVVPDKFAAAFLEKGELVYKEKKVLTRLLSSVVQEKVRTAQGPVPIPTHDEI